MLQIILCWFGRHPSWTKPVYINGRHAYDRCLHCYRAFNHEHTRKQDQDTLGYETRPRRDTPH